MLKHYLTIYVDGKKQETICLNNLESFYSGRISIGRLESNDIVLAYPIVSRTHAYLEVQGNKLELVDNGSLNKLRVGGNVSPRIRLASGMKVLIGTSPRAVGAIVLQYNVIDDAPQPDPRMQQSMGRASTQPQRRQTAPQSGKTFFVQRVLAMMIDYMICMFIWFGAFVLIFITRFPWFDHGFVPAVVLAALAVGWLYYALLESSAKQATLGKLIMGLYVVDAHGAMPSFGLASKRFFAKILSGIILGIGFLPIFGHKQTLHDRLTGCRVVKQNL